MLQDDDQDKWWIEESINGWIDESEYIFTPIRIGGEGDKERYEYNKEGIIDCFVYFMWNLYLNNSGIEESKRLWDGLWFFHRIYFISEVLVVLVIHNGLLEIIIVDIENILLHIHVYFNVFVTVRKS